ncbi:MAG: polysaccharide biosynthesis protein [Chloroflexaceae bacterium]|nr:polysaccharide biosynthesis protein [Chloroflexaceae bacterium]
MKWLVRNRYLLASDSILLVVATYLSFVLRLDTFVLTHHWATWLLLTLLVVPTTLVTFLQARVYVRYWPYASVEELLLLSGCVTFAVASAGSLSLLLSWWEGADIGITPRSVPFILLPLALGATAAPRLMLRLAARELARTPPSQKHAQPVLVIGAGKAGDMMVREIKHNPQVGMRVVGFVDDDPRKHGVRIQGVPVLGACQDIPSLVELYRFRQAIIAMPTAPGKVIRRMVRLCERSGVKARIIPGIYELLDGRVSVNQLRPVQIEDLLRREPVQTNIEAVSALIRGKRVLVTGAGGSIGSELCRQVLRCEPSELVLVGHGENSVFEIHHELQQTRPRASIHAVIADMRFRKRVFAVFRTHQPEMVFHAAAHKHVPLMEMNPEEAITNNVLGTRNALAASLAVGVEHFVMVSTDKAVNPTSMMGASKRVAEFLVHHAALMSGKPYVSVRFGNVLGSRGSVVLTFKRQIANGGPVTVTHPEMQRYFMTIPEAVQLVLQAATMASGTGRVFILDMGDPVKLVDLARDMITLSGLEVGRDIDIVFTGIRPGEKLYEELFLHNERYQRTAHEKIFAVNRIGDELLPNLEEAVEHLIQAAHEHDQEELFRTLHHLIPELQLTRMNGHVSPSPAPTPQKAAATTLERERGANGVGVGVIPSR